MDNRPQHKNRANSGLVARLNRTAGDVNVVLLVVAIGLAMLDLTCFLAFKTREALPSPARIESNASVASKPIVVQSQSPVAATGQVTAVAPTQPNATKW